MPRTSEQLAQVRNQTRNKIIEAAIKLFSQKGFHGTSMSEIAKHAGVAKGLSYNYFKSKLDLLNAIFEMMMERGLQIIKDIKKIEDPYEQIVILINKSFSYALAYEEFWRLYMRMAFQPEVLPTTENITEKFSDFILKQIEKIFRKIGFKNPAAEAQIFSASLDGLLLYYLVNPKNFPLNKVKNLLLQRYSKNGISAYIASLDN
ncbi:MAG: hypothetical protein CVV23_07800 [Ignavibacteriae bacterium HGW-Ignavibacteriae-2]|jgi:AcrR family transcriptional regulator|nr:MAG: hypothetical protein CVV23_07800 [Ignavibacteriae bacterium HGW-Ignavibacteriae-2]